MSSTLTSLLDLSAIKKEKDYGPDLHTDNMGVPTSGETTSASPDKHILAGEKIRSEEKSTACINREPKLTSSPPQPTSSSPSSSTSSNITTSASLITNGEEAASKSTYLSFAHSNGNRNTQSINGGVLNSRSLSPHSTMNGSSSTPSPPSLSSHAQEHHPAPPSSSAALLSPSSRDTQRQVAKVRRFLTTLQQFASEINADAGEKVRGLTLNLMSGAVSVEEFHLALQEVTHFPLRPFVLPFLRSHIPLLTRELKRHAARHSMTVQQYVTVQEAALLEVAASGEPGTDFFTQDPNAVTTQPANFGTSSGSLKRKHQASFFEQNDSKTVGVSAGMMTKENSVSPPPAKRLGLFSPPFMALGGSSPDPPTQLIPPSLSSGSQTYRESNSSANDDEWKNIHMMLNCILSMVEKTRKALTILQPKEDPIRTPSRHSSTSGENGRINERNSEYDAEVRRHASELVAQAIRSTEDRVVEVKRKAEEAVAEVRRAAVAEVQRAVNAAETRAHEMVTAERSRIEVMLREMGRRESGEQRTETHLACWNCGRKAPETCSGCNVARYCGPICQHKDWDTHHKVCSPLLLTNPNNSSSNNTNNSAPSNNLQTSPVNQNNGHITTPKLTTVTHKLLAKATESSKLE